MSFMNFWNLFKSVENTTSSESQLHEKIRELLPDAKDDTHIIVACVAGLMAQVAFSDMVVEEEEVHQMKKCLKEFSQLTEDQVEATVQVALENVKSLCGVENYLYTDPLSTMLDINSRFSLLKALFQIAASDGKAEEIESEEIRLITKGLLLEHKHFIAARATVAENLQVLKK